jgi:hypothetical protein
MNLESLSSYSLGFLVYLTTFHNSPILSPQLCYLNYRQKVPRIATLGIASVVVER